MGDQSIDQEFSIVELEPRQAPSPDAFHFGSGGSGGGSGSVGSGGSGGSVGSGGSGGGIPITGTFVGTISGGSGGSGT
jgi:hypothetical protein